MSARRRQLIASTAVLCISATAAATAQRRPEQAAPQSFVYFGLDRERIGEETFLSNPGVVGAQLRYTWKELEPEPSEEILPFLGVLGAQGEEPPAER